MGQPGGVHLRFSFCMGVVSSDGTFQMPLEDKAMQRYMKRLSRYRVLHGYRPNANMMLEYSKPENTR